MSKYKTISVRPIYEKTSNAVYLGGKKIEQADIPVLFRLAMANPGEIRFWRNDKEQEFCAVYDPLLMEIHTDLDA